ncbi:aminotransferase-like domain-containing protein [Ramlibacter sp. AN1133]|uniref:aminotransferase-like domain-containing protein n=1 Tax=Ramlibacter sp. AN1133 TaxID=3133429 RepID=UPI0030BF7419
MDDPMAKSGQQKKAKSTAAAGIALDRVNHRRAAHGPVYRQLYDTIKEAILAGTFPDGARLPSSRSLAVQLGLSRTTVDLAYNLLAGDGLVQGRTAKGTRVTSGVKAPVAPQRKALALGASMSPARSLPLAPGAAAVDLFPRALWSRLATRHAKSLLPDDLVARDPAGHPRLREAIANRVRLVRGMACDAGQVFVTAGVAGAVLLVANACGAQCKKTLAHRETLSLPLRHAFEALGISIEAPDFSALEGNRWPAAALAVVNAEDLEMRARPRHAAVTRSLVQWARSHSAWMLEEDRDLDLFHEGLHPALLAGSAAPEVSIYLGSFERSVFPAVGCAFVVVPHALVEQFAAASEQSPWTAPLQTQRVLSDFITQGYIGRHANRLRRTHQERRQFAIGMLRKGRATGRLHFEAVGSCLVASLQPLGPTTDLRTDLRLSGLGAKVLCAPDLPCELLQLGYAGVPAKELGAAIEQLDALLARL